jgi:phosphoserine/homoserine phosphotransferase
MWAVCIDLESILIPEIWKKLAKELKIEELKLTTREIPDFKLLMEKRLNALSKNNVKIQDLQKIVRKIKPLKGALPFLNWLRKNFPTIIVSDTFFEFWKAVGERLNWPVVFCNNFDVDEKGFIRGYKIRKENRKLETVKALKFLGYKVVAIGDSYNDLAMLKTADVGILFKAPRELRDKFPQFKFAKDYKELKSILENILYGNKI